MEVNLYQKMVIDQLDRLFPYQQHTITSMPTQHIVTELRTLVESLYMPSTSRPNPFTTVASSGEPLARRCGTLVWSAGDESQEQSLLDNHDLYLPDIRSPHSQLRGDRGGVSSFYVKRCIYLAFFGDTNDYDECRTSERL